MKLINLVWLTFNELKLLEIFYLLLLFIFLIIPKSLKISEN